MYNFLKYDLSHRINSSGLDCCRSIKSKIVEAVAWNQQLSVLHKGVFSCDIFTEDTEQLVLGKGSHLRNLIVAQSTVAIA